MLIAETCLLLAVRNRLRTFMSLDEHQCDIELDDQVPTLAREKYFTVTSAGTKPGPRHSTAAGTWDLQFSIKVTFYQGAAEVPRDRRRNLFIDRLQGINFELTKVIQALWFDYQNVIAAAETLLVGTEAAGGNFPEPFRMFTPDPSVIPVLREPYNAAAGASGGDPITSLARGVTFSGARFMKEPS